jgi:hypothetical protein
MGRAVAKDKALRRCSRADFLLGFPQPCRRCLRSRRNKAARLDGRHDSVTGPLTDAGRLPVQIGSGRGASSLRAGSRKLNAGVVAEDATGTLASERLARCNGRPRVFPAFFRGESAISLSIRNAVFIIQPDAAISISL